MFPGNTAVNALECSLSFNKYIVSNGWQLLNCSIEFKVQTPVVINVSTECMGIPCTMRFDPETSSPPSVNFWWIVWHNKHCFSMNSKSEKAMCASVSSLLPWSSMYGSAMHMCTCVCVCAFGHFL